MTAVTEKQRRVKPSLVSDIVRRIRWILRAIARELRPEGPRKRLLKRCRERRENR